MPTIAIIGGSGPEGRGLGLRFAIAGHTVVLGSRDAARAADAASTVLSLRRGLPVSGALNADAARAADWVVFSVPYDGLRPTVRGLAPALVGKLVVSVVAPLRFEAGVPLPVLVPEGSAAAQVQALLPDSRVTSAFHNLSARELLKPDDLLHGDVIVCGHDRAARQEVMRLASSLPRLRGIDGGGLEHARCVEELTALLLFINRTYKTNSTIQVLGV